MHDYTYTAYYWKFYIIEETSVGVPSGVKIQVNVQNPGTGFSDDICQQFSDGL